MIRWLKSDNYLKNPINRTCPDITKLQKLGWKPKIAIKQGFKKPWFWLIVLLVMAVFSILIYIES